MVRFSIFLPTYNRRTLVVNALRSLSAQTYGNFEVLLCDNGSIPSVRDIAEGFRDERIIYKRFDENRDINDVAEDAIDRMTGSHFLFLADDDVLLPAALKVVESLLRAHGIEVLHAGFTHFDHSALACDVRRAGLERFTGKLEVFDAREMALHYATGWGIGPRRQYRAPRASHSSAIFLAKSVIDRTRRRQGQLFIKPFGDIGYVGALLNTDKCLAIDLPLAVVGETPIREMNGAKPGQRQKWNKEIQHIEHSPLKAASFVNMGADAHLKVILRNNLGKPQDFRLRPDFYFRHLNQVLSDRPWTLRTLRDAVESLPHALSSVFWHLDLRDLLPQGIPEKVRHVFGGNERTEPPSPMPFDDINQFAAWVQSTCVEPLLEKEHPRGVPR